MHKWLQTFQRRSYSDMNYIFEEILLTYSFRSEDVLSMQKLQRYIILDFYNYKREVFCLELSFPFHESWPSFRGTIAFKGLVFFHFLIIDLVHVRPHVRPPARPPASLDFHQRPDFAIVKPLVMGGYFWKLISDFTIFLQGII